MTDFPTLSHIFWLVKSLSFHIPEAWKRLLFKADAIIGSTPPRMFHQPLNVLESDNRCGLQNVWVVKLIFILFSSFKYYILLSILSFRSRTHFNITCNIYWSLSTLYRRNEKNSFISTVRPSIHTNLSQSTALFLRLGIPTSLIRQKTQLYFCG